MISAKRETMKPESRTRVDSQSVLEKLDERSSTIERTKSDNSLSSRTARTKNGKSAVPTVKNTKRKRDAESKIQVDTAVKNLINLAKYEIDVDPYRGIFDDNHAEYFAKCANALTTFSISKIHDEEGSCCPCVNSWIQEEKEQQKSAIERSRKAKKRKSSIVGPKVKSKRKGRSGKQNDSSKDTSEDVKPREVASDGNSRRTAVVRRNSSPSFACSCDFNPFCLASVGGVVDAILNKGAFSRLVNQDIDSKAKEDEIEEVTENSKASTSITENGEVENLEPTSSTNKFEMNENSSADISGCIVSTAAKSHDDLQLRKMVQVDTDKVMHHLKTVVLPEIDDDDVDHVLSAAKEWHKNLLYNGNERQLKDDKFGYCGPVGLRNLGATCYLNSQLQCLAANLPFIDGVFSWNVNKDDTNQMVLVISKLQSVLAQMIHGPQNIECTDEFSASMHLENNEMQDPNEFARLLFDRMHESFQQLSATQQNCANLRNLLPSIFRGAFTYQTTCLRCNNASRRKEDFMDLNLPIVVEKNSSKELTVEFLLDEYFQPEQMGGENKYRCENCQDVCDAERVVSLDTAPPVLNIQLARYVFDMKTFRKRKLTNKILLPKSLQLKSTNGETDVIYILYAVQNHRGSSAYTGHYVAEVMDWTTGVWFECDDEKVSLLQHGPNSSYDPDRTATTRLKGGTSDAYNIFYVEESYLQEGVKGFIDKTISSPAEGIVGMVSEDRKRSFALQKEMLQYQQEANDRINERRLAISRMIFSDEAAQGTPEIWVEGSTLRRFFSSSDLMEGLLDKTEMPILKHKRLLCEHGKGLHPNVARCGKLLTKTQFERYLDLLQSERERLQPKQENNRVTDELVGTVSDAMPVCDLVIQRDSHLFCEQCADKYKHDLRSKVDKFTELNHLNDILSPSSNHGISIKDDEGIFAISKSFIAAFRKVAWKILKPSALSSGCTTINTDVPVEGIDHFETSHFALFPEEDEVEIVVPPTTKDYLDPKVNSKIVCEHGHCENVNNKLTIRFVSDKTWTSICSFFPQAIAIPITVSGGNSQSCSLCQEAKECNSSFLAKLSAWASNDLNKDVKKKPSLNSTSGYYRLVHAADIGNWKKAVDLAKRNRKRDKTGKKIRTHLRSLLFTESMVLDDSQGFTLSRRLQCVKHAKPLLSVRCFRAIHHQMSTQSTGTTEHNQDVPLTLISEEIFSNYLSSMLELEEIVALDDNLCSEKFLYENYHPKLTLENAPADCEGIIDLNEFFTDSPHVLGQLLHFTQKPCDEKSCVDEYHQYLCALPSQEEEKPPETQRTENSVASQEIDIIDDEQLIFKVHEFAGFTDDTTAQAILEKRFKGKLNIEAPAATDIRRSSRKRNAPSDTTTFTLRCKKGDNLAQFRLRIYEQSNNIKISTHRLSVFLFNTDSQEGTMMEILGSWNELRMEEVLTKCPLTIPLEETIHIVLASSNLSKKQMGSDGNDVEDDSTVLDVLAFIATGVESPKKSGKSSGKKKQNQERGFAGTFLQSSFHQSNQSAELVDGNGIVPNNKAIAIDISDDELDNSTSRTEVFEEDKADTVAEDKIDQSATCAEAEGKIDQSTPFTEADEEVKIDESPPCNNADADAENKSDKSTPYTEPDVDVDDKINSSTPCSEAEAEVRNDESAPCRVAYVDDKNDKSIPCANADDATKLGMKAEAGINNAPITEQYSVVSLIISKVYDSTDSVLLPNFDTSCGKEPPIPSAKGACLQYSSKEIQGIISSNSDIHKQDIESIITRLQLDPAARNIFRNFGDTEVDTYSRRTKNIPISRRELDIALYFLNTNQSEKDCQQLLMPYRPQRFVKSIFASLKKDKLAPNTGKAYPEYMQHVLFYVKHICSLEQICKCDDDQK